MLLGNIIAGLIRALFPKAPAFLASFVGTLIPLVIELVQELMDSDLVGTAKFEEVMAGTKELLDESFDTLPEWSELSEEKRDLIIGGIIELTVFVVKVGGKSGGRKALRQVAKAIRRNK